MKKENKLVIAITSLLDYSLILILLIIGLKLLLEGNWLNAGILFIAQSMMSIEGILFRLEDKLKNLN